MSVDVISVNVKFFHNEFDNYQGGSGKTIILEKIINLTACTDLKSVEGVVVSTLNKLGYNDNEMCSSLAQFTGRGLISIKLGVGYETKQ